MDSLLEINTLQGHISSIYLLTPHSFLIVRLQNGGIEGSEIHCILFFQENAVHYGGFIIGELGV